MLLSVCALGCALPVMAQGAARHTTHIPLGETAESHKARMQWWDEAKFGLFIHWGLYAVQGGEWEGVDYGKEAEGYASAEWLMLQANIEPEEYAKIAAKFNPVKFNAEEWVLLAKNAGMKYINITAKHHDGFSLYDSPSTDYDMVDATPFKRDVIAELAEACRKHDMKLGFYYSHHIDWHRRGLFKGSKLGNASDEYADFVRAQLEELLTQYGDVACIWFDLGRKSDKENNRSYYDLVRAKQPKCIVSGRLEANGKMTDYSTGGDRTITKRNSNRYTESCMTSRLNWGYDKDDDAWPAHNDMVRLLSLCAARGSNLLLNVGPQPDGQFCPEEIAMLKHFSAWMTINSEAIHGTIGSPYNGDFQWGTVTRNGATWYAHVLNDPVESVVLPGLSVLPTSVSILGSDAALNPELTDDGLVIRLPASTSVDPAASKQEQSPEVRIVKITFNQAPEVAAGSHTGYAWHVPQRHGTHVHETYKEWSSPRETKSKQKK